MSDNVYVNVTIPNSTGDTLPSSRTSIAYEYPILDKPSDYYMAVAKFAIPLGSLPLMVWPATSPENLLTVGVCGVAENTLAPIFNGVDTALIYSNNYKTLGLDYDYAYIYSYQYFIDMLNTALATSWASAAGDGPGSLGAVPYFIRENNANGLIKLVMPVSFTDDVTVSAAGNTVYFNENVQILLQSFNVQRTKVFCTADPSSNRFEVITGSFNGISGYDESVLSQAPFTVSSYIIAQEFPTNDWLNSVRKVVITSNSLPIVTEVYPPPINSVGTAAYNNVPIITDFQLDLENVTGAQRGIALYDAQIYRLIDMISDHPMKRIDLEVFWVDEENNFYPLPLLPYDAITIKLAFLKKDLFKNGEIYKPLENKEIGGRMNCFY